MGSHESIVTLGMRGDGDMPMTQGSNIALLERIVADQRKIIADVTGKPAVGRRRSSGRSTRKCRTTTTRACACPTTSRCSLPTTTGATSAACRRATRRKRAGGFGVYYHFDYVGGPRNYKWINTNPIARVWEQMHLAHEYGANRIWIVNVGDLKPMEFPISVLPRLRVESRRDGPPSGCREYTRAWAAQQFGAAHARGDRGHHRRRTLKYDGRRKPELLDTDDLQPDELSGSRARRRRLRRAAARAPSDRRSAAGRRSSDAYYELVLHPVRGGREPERAVRRGGEEPPVRPAGARVDERPRRQRRARCSTATPRSRGTTTRSSPAASGTT